MVNQYVGEIKMAAFNFAPAGWALCAGQILPIQQYAALFSLLGTQYGGNGSTNFGLPDLQGRANGGVGPNLYTSQGMKTGTENVTITSNTYPLHTHAFAVNSAAGNLTAPANNYLAGVLPLPPPPPRPPGNLYTAAQGARLQPLNPAAISTAPGGNQPHENMMPYLVMNYIIALVGVFPPRS
jgi:microcystin-dependent protein